jgi:tetrapyrrole methylase family protein/MazG family protein
VSEVIVVGMGPGPVNLLTLEAREVLLAEKEIYFRLSAHPVCLWLQDQGKDCVCFDFLYRQPGIDYERVYKTINSALVKVAKKHGRAVYALPGNPAVFEKTTRWLKRLAEAAAVEVRTVVGMSFLETIYLELDLDPEEGLQILNASAFSLYGDYPFTEKLGILIGQLGLPREMTPTCLETNARDVAEALLKKFPSDHPVTLAWSSGMPDYQNKKMSFPLFELVRLSGYVKTLATLYVPPIRPPWET